MVELKVGFGEKISGKYRFAHQQTRHLHSSSECVMSGPARVVEIAAVSAALLCWCSVASAQRPQTPSSNVPASTAPQEKQAMQSYEGQKVASLEIAGRPDLDPHELMPYVAQKEGEPFSQAKIDQSVENLKQHAGQQDVQVQLFPDVNGVRVLLVLQPGMYFGVYEFPGALTRFPYTRLLQVAEYPPEGPYSIADVERATAKLLTFYRRNGYFLAQVHPEIQPDAPHGIVNVSFRTELGKKAKFGDVIMEGTTPEQTRQLQRKLKSVMARLRGAAIRRNKKYSQATLNNAVRYLENSLVKKDYLGASVKLVGANYDPATNRADISLHVQTGPPVHVKVEGAHLWSWTRHKLLPVYQQLGVDQELIQEGRQNLISHFQSKGFFDAQVQVDVQQQGAGQAITYRITKGPRHKVMGVSVAGNQSLTDKELLPHVAVEKARFFSHGEYSNKLVNTSVKNLQAVYRSAGFSTVKVTPQVQNHDGNISVAFQVNEGPRDIVQALIFQGNSLSPTQLAPKGLNVVEGQPYSQKLVDQDRTQIMARYLELGYLTATFHARAKPVSKQEPHQLQVTYQIYEGPQVIATSVMTVGRDKTKQSFINRTAELKAGEPLRENELLTSESKLYTPGIFDWAEVDPRRQITTQNGEDVVVKVHEAQRHQLTYGFGFEVINRGGSVPSGTIAVPGIPPIGLSKNFKTSEKTFWGPRGSLEYTLKNVRGRAETITVGGLAGRLDQRASFSYQDPNFRNSDWASNLTVSGEHNSENPIFSLSEGESGFQVQRPLDEKKTQNLFVRYSFRESILNRLLIPDLIPQEDRHVRLSTVSSTYTRDTRDNALDAHKGIYQSFEFDLNPEALGSNVSFGKFLGQTAYYHKLPKEIVWASSLRLGIEEPFAGSHVPVSERFFSGGGSTLRGFPLNGAGPQRSVSACDSSACFPISVPVGGRELLIVNSEFRIPVPIKKGLGVATFYDGGNVFSHVGFHGQYTNTFGIGLRYATPVGPIRFDIGHNLNAPPGVKSTQFFVTLGQAF
jgi:outer membrane protein assembly factor BamA